jgi:hypothetical protein
MEEDSVEAASFGFGGGGGGRCMGRADDVVWYQVGPCLSILLGPNYSE